jgi:hypothetical protein
MTATEQCVNITFCFLLYKSSLELLRMLVEAYAKAAMKKT